MEYFIVRCGSPKTQNEITNLYPLSERTLRRWGRNNGLPKKKPGRKSKINEEAKKLLLDYIKVNNTKTQSEMSDYLQQVGLKVSQPTVSRLLKKENITRKKVAYRYSEQKPKMEEIKSFTEKLRFLSLLDYPMFFLDECSFHLNEAARRGYSKRGERCVSYNKPGNKGLNHTLILCVQIVKEKAVVSYELIESGLKTQSFYNFLINLRLPPDKDCYLMMDNLPVHRARQSCLDLGLLPIKELLKARRAITLYLPAYTPQLNPVELCFNFIRNYIEKHQPRTFEELSIILSQAMENLNQKDLTKYLEHCLNYYSESGQS